MRPLREYQIQFVGLSLGTHQYSFEIGNTFFEHFDNQDLQDVDIKLEIELEKKNTMMQIRIEYSGRALVSCDRCGADMTLPMNGEHELIVKFGDTGYENQTDDIVVISPNEYQLDLSSYIYEFIMVDVPLSHRHEEGDCDPEVIKVLEKYSIEKQQTETEPDPRWAALKKNKNE